ncbi:MAG: hypothetical protein SOW78_00195 [Clostridia bacterium]|nr:hypothetical protein [Clostridia bacterium]
MNKLPDSIYSGEYKEGHVQGIAIDPKRGFVYYSFTTIFLKTDLLGNPIGSVIKLAGHLGCITYDEQTNSVYGSLELKHDVIGSGIIRKTGWDPSSEDAFYLVCFDCEAIDRMNMNAETDGVMKAVYLTDVINDYAGIDEVSGKKHRYGCSGIDGVGLGPVFGFSPDSENKIMVAYGIYGDPERQDNDHQIILQYDRSIIDVYGQSLNQSLPHHSGPKACEKRYFFYTGNTEFGVQNLEYDSFTGNWYLAVYAGKKPTFDNFNMFFIDGKVAASPSILTGRNGETGLLLTSAAIGTQGRQKEIYGTRFPYGQTGMASLGNGIFCFSQPGHNRIERTFSTKIRQYAYTENDPFVFTEANI